MPLMNSNDLEKLMPRIVIYGEPGSGKTTLAATCADLGNTLLIAYKSQPQVVLDNKYKFPLTIYQVNSLNELNDILTYLYIRGGSIKKEFEEAKIDTDFKWVIFDGWTSAQADYAIILNRTDLKAMDKPVWKASQHSLTNLTKLEWPEYGDLLNMSNSLTTHLYNLDVPVIITALERENKGTYDIMSIGQGGTMLKSGCNILARSTLKDDKHFLRIRQGAGVEASYRFVGKHDKPVLTNTNIGQLING